MSKAFFQFVGSVEVIENTLLDETATLRTLSNFMLDEGAVSRQIFHDIIVPTAPLAGMSRQFAVLDAREFKVTDNREFKV